MIAWWPHWFRPAWLLLLPLLGGLLWQLWHREKRSGRWELILPVAFHAALLRGGRGRASRAPLIALGLAWLLALLALLGPSWQRVEQTSRTPLDPLVVLLQLTPDMLAADTPPNRLEQARRKVMDLLQARGDVQTAIVVYAGSAHTLVPLSDDLITSRNLLDALRPSIMPEGGQRADLAVQQGLKLLHGADLGEGRLLWIGSALSDAERQGMRQALRGHATPLLMLGIGTAEGAPVAQEKGGFLKDDNGAILVPRLDSASLSAFANEVGGRFHTARVDDQDLHELGLFDSPRALRASGHLVRLDSWQDQGYWLLLPLLLIAACAGRRGWLFCLPLLMVLTPRPAMAFDLQDLWLRRDQQGASLLQQQRPAEAARRFDQRQWKGVALYRAGDYLGAARHFAEGDSATDHYNRGNALAMNGDLAAAIDAYDQALERQPQLQAALDNRALLQRLLEQQQRDAAQAQAEAANAEQAQEAQAPATSPPPPQTSAQGNDEDGDPSQGPAQPPSGNSAQRHDAPPGDDEVTRPPKRPADTAMTGERRQALEQWLRQIPDDPGELLRRKFWYEQQQRQDKHP